MHEPEQSHIALFYKQMITKRNVHFISLLFYRKENMTMQTFGVLNFKDLNVRKAGTDAEADVDFVFETPEL